MVESNILDQKSLIEAILFVSGEPITIDILKKVTEIPEKEIKEILNRLISEYKERNSGIFIAEIADGFQMMTAPEFSFYIKRLKNINQSNRLSQAALETLSIIAYKQPITKLEVDLIRGVNSDGAIKSLLDKRLIKIVGKKESPGRPFLYGTTKEFLHYFGLKNLSELPPLENILKEEAA